MFDHYDKLPDAKKLLEAAKSAYEASEPAHLRAFDAFSKDQVNGRWRKVIASARPRKWEELQPENPLREMVTTYTPHVLGNDVAPEVTPLSLGDQGRATIREYRLRRLLDDMGYSDEHDAAVMDALHSIGITYFGIKSGQTLMQIGESTLDEGQAFIKRIPISAFFYDPNEPIWKQKAYMGHGYTACAASVLDILGRNAEAARIISSIPKVWETDKFGGQSVMPWTSGTAKEDEFLEDLIPLWDMAFKHRGKRYRCVLPPMNGPNGFVVPPFEDMEMETGPYNVLELGLSTGDGIALSPAMAMMDAHLVGKAMAGRLAWEGLNTRRKAVAEQGDQAFVMKLLDPNDPDGIVYSNGGKVQEVTIGGMVRELLEAYTVMKQMRQTIGPNVMLAGGQDDPSDSATGTSILQGNAGMGFAFWRNRIKRWAAKNLECLSWSLDTEEGMRQQYDFPLPNGKTVPIVWSGDTRDTSYNQFKYSIKPSTEVAMDPRQKLRSLFEIMAAIPPFIQATLMMNGDPRAAIEAVAHVAQMPELARILPTSSAMVVQQQLMQAMASSAMQLQGRSGAGGMGGKPARAGMSGQMDQRQSDYAMAR